MNCSFEKNIFQSSISHYEKSYRRHPSRLCLCNRVDCWIKGEDLNALQQQALFLHCGKIARTPLDATLMNHSSSQPWIGNTDGIDKN
jgi:hypothetical protein